MACLGLFSQRSVVFAARPFGLSVVNHDGFPVPYHSAFPGEGILRKRKSPSSLETLNEHKGTVNETAEV